MHGKIFVVGGLDGNNRAVKTIECYDPQVDSWSIVGKTKRRIILSLGCSVIDRFCAFAKKNLSSVSMKGKKGFFEYFGVTRR